jgi:hypothetical protein|tara:strand:+ start:1294 stop:1545 length:252 start_codon:yes stop_codon:yes gene_type:complete
MDLLDGPFGVQLELEADTRVFNITGRASAAMLLFFLMDASEGSLIAKLKNEAQFDTMLISYNMDSGEPFPTLEEIAKNVEDDD